MPDPISSNENRSPAKIFTAFAVTLPLMYYMVVLLHEWGHGTTAWLFGDKNSPFDIRYGGWFLMNCDEAVSYDRLLAEGHGLQAALIGISGFTVNAILFGLSLHFLSRRKTSGSVWALGALFWSCILNWMAMFGYIPLNTFSVQGDVGRFVHGLQISPLWVFIPGTLLIGWALVRLLRKELIRVYVFAPIRTLAMKRVLLTATLFFLFLFLFLFTRGYNPFTDSGAPQISQILAACSILLFPILLLVCDPSRSWVQQAIEEQEKTRR